MNDDKVVTTLEVREDKLTITIIAVFAFILGGVGIGGIYGYARYKQGHQDGWRKHDDMSRNFPLGHCNVCNDHTSETCQGCYRRACGECHINRDTCKGCSEELIRLRKMQKDLNERHIAEEEEMATQIETAISKLRTGKERDVHRDRAGEYEE